MKKSDSFVGLLTEDKINAKDLLRNALAEVVYRRTQPKDNDNYMDAIDGWRIAQVSVNTLLEASFDRAFNEHNF